jgi:gamma-glutamyltranspeptidase/glutathione hydrolase
MINRRSVTKGLLAGGLTGGLLLGRPGVGLGLGRGFELAPLGGDDRLFPVEAAGGMVVSREARATRVGVTVLEAGGNAIDAAVATAFALSVTLPQAGNLGGGGFALVHRADTGETHALDFRETAPAGAHRDLFLGDDGEVDKDRARYSHRSVGVPGSVAGYLEALERWGTLSRAQVVAPAIGLARDGFEVGPALHRNISRRIERLAKWPATRAVIARPDGSALQPGDIMRQPDLAESLTQIAETGADAFYRGPIGALLAAEMVRHDGLIDRGDLEAYRAVLRAPVSGNYRGLKVLSMPPPSSGGAHLVQMLNILEGWDLAALGSGSAAILHRMAEAMRRAYADRAAHLGDPDFWGVPLDWLTSKAYAEEMRAGIDLYRASLSSDIRAGVPAPSESRDTTHLSVMDRDGNAVSMTTTLNFGFGTGIVAEGTGIFLNNEMDDFSAKPGVPNAYGLVGGDANAIQPGKRPLSSMTPTLMMDGDRVIASLGSPGGSRIITTVLQVILNLVDHRMNVAEAVAAPRVHHQWLPDTLRAEAGLSPDTLDILRAIGHSVEVGRAFGAAQAITRGTDGFRGSTDPRRPGGLAAGPRA